MRRFAWALLLATAFPVTVCATVDEAATSKDQDLVPGEPSIDVMAKDCLRAATPEASPLSRLALSQGVAFWSQPGMPANTISAAQWQPVRDQALRDGADDPMVQAVYLIGNRTATAGAASRDHAVDLLTGLVNQNGHFGLILLSIPEVAGDAQAERDILHQTARATDFDSTYTATQQALVADLADFRWTRKESEVSVLPEISDDLQTATIASALSSMVAISQIGTIFKLCKNATGVVSEDCQLLGQNLFKHAETAIDVTVSLRLIEMTAPNEQVRVQASNERRRFDWQTEQLQSMWAQGKYDTPNIRQHLERQRHLTELAAMHETLVAMNLPLEPPTGWRSRTEQYREQEQKAAKKSSP